MSKVCRVEKLRYDLEYKKSERIRCSHSLDWARRCQVKTHRQHSEVFPSEWRHGE